MNIKRFTSFIGILTCFSKLTYGQVEVCMFYNLHADCYYRVDSICLSHITAEINQCTDPIEVTFKITCNRPSVDFEHTFSSSDEVVSVPGYNKQVQLHVKLTMKEDDILNVEADFYVSGKEKTDFVNSEVKLKGLSDTCPLLNRAAQIAMGTMGGLTALAAILILILVFVRRRRKAKAAQSSNDLIRNAENPGLSTPRASRTQETLVEEQMANGHVTSINRSDSEHVTAVKRSDKRHVTAINRSDNGHVTAINRSEDDRVSSINRQQFSSSADSDGSNTQNGFNSWTSEPDRGGQAWSQQHDAVRFSDVLKSNHGNQLKISDC